MIEYLQSRGGGGYGARRPIKSYLSFFNAKLGMSHYSPLEIIGHCPSPRHFSSSHLSLSYPSPSQLHSAHYGKLKVPTAIKLITMMVSRRHSDHASHAATPIYYPVKLQCAHLYIFVLPTPCSFFLLLNHHLSLQQHLTP